MPFGNSARSVGFVVEGRMDDTQLRHGVKRVTQEIARLGAEMRAGGGSSAQFSRAMSRTRQEALEMAQGLDRASDEYLELQRAAGRAQAEINRSHGQFSQNIGMVRGQLGMLTDMARAAYAAMAEGAASLEERGVTKPAANLRVMTDELGRAKSAWLEYFAAATAGGDQAVSITTRIARATTDAATAMQGFEVRTAGIVAAQQAMIQAGDRTAAFSLYTRHLANDLEGVQRLLAQSPAYLAAYDGALNRTSVSMGAMTQAEAAHAAGLDDLYFRYQRMVHGATQVVPAQDQATESIWRFTSATSAAGEESRYTYNSMYMLGEAANYAGGETARAGEETRYTAMHIEYLAAAAIVGRGGVGALAGALWELYDSAGAVIGQLAGVIDAANEIGAIQGRLMPKVGLDQARQRYHEAAVRLGQASTFEERTIALRDTLRAKEQMQRAQEVYNRTPTGVGPLGGGYTPPFHAGAGRTGGGGAGRAGGGVGRSGPDPVKEAQRIAEAAARASQRVWDQWEQRAQQAIGTVRSSVERVLGDLSGSIGSNDALLDQFGLRAEGPDEIIRRLNSVLAEGREGGGKQWADYYAGLLGLNDQMTNDEVKARAAALIRDVQAGFRLDVLDKDAIKAAVRRDIEAANLRETYYDEIARELSEEGLAKSQIERALGREQGQQALIGSILEDTTAAVEARAAGIKEAGALITEYLYEGISERAARPDKDAATFLVALQQSMRTQFDTDRRQWEHMGGQILQALLAGGMTEAEHGGMWVRALRDSIISAVLALLAQAGEQASTSSTSGATA